MMMRQTTHDTKNVIYLGLDIRTRKLHLVIVSQDRPREQDNTKQRPTTRTGQNLSELDARVLPFDFACIFKHVIACGTAKTCQCHDKTRQDKTRRDKTRQGRTRQDTRQDKTRQGKTRQDTRQARQGKTRQDKTRANMTTARQEKT